MPHVPYQPKPVPPSAVESSMALFSTPGPRSEPPRPYETTPSGPPDAVLDDFPAAPSPKQPESQRRPEIERGRPLRRANGPRSGLSRISMAEFNPHPGAVSKLLNLSR